MLKNILFLFVLLVCNQAYAVQNSNTAMTDVQHLIEQGKHSTAISDLQRLLKADPENYQAWFLLGVSQAELQQFDAAISAFHQVVALQPKLAEPHNNLAVIYDEMGNIRAAVNELEASLVLKPGYATAQENLGDLYVKLAADAYQKVLTRNKNPTLQRRYQGLLQLASDANSSILPAAMTTKATPVSVSVSKPSSNSKTKSNSKSESKSTPSAVEKTPAVASAAAPKALNDTEKQTVLKALETWRTAWSNKNTAAYFAAYSDDFEYGQRYKSLAKWQAYKAWAIQKRRFININIEHIVSTSMSETQVKLTFLQHFRSDSFNSDDNKEMVFQHSSNGWKIIYEVSM